MSFVSRVARNTAILIITHFITYAISIVVLGALGRYLGPDGYGQFEYVGSILSLFYLFASMGLDFLLVREVAGRRPQTGEYLSAVLSLKLVLFLVVAALYYGFVGGAAQSPEVVRALGFAGIAILFTSLSTSFQAVFNAHERMGFRSVTYLALNLVQLIGILVLIRVQGGVVGAVFVYHVLGSASGMLVAGASVWRYFTPVRLRAVPRLWVRFLRQSISFFTSEVAGRVYFRGDIILLREIVRVDNIVGWFSASKKILEALHMFTSALTHALYPALAHRFASGQEDRAGMLRAMSRVILLIAMPMGVFLVVCAPGIIDLIFTREEFGPSVPLLRALGPVAALLVYDTFITYFAFVLKLERSVRRISLTRIFFTLGVDIVLIKLWGAMGAVLGAGLSNCYNLGWCLWLVRRQLGPLELHRALVKPLAVSGCFAVILYPMRDWPILGVMPVAGIAFAALLWIFGELGREQLRQMGWLGAQREDSSSASGGKRTE